MRIKLLQSLVSPRFDYRPGQVVDHPDAEAQRLIDAGIAVAAPDYAGNAVGALEVLGLATPEHATAMPDVQLAELAAAVAKVKDPGERVALAAAALGPRHELLASLIPPPPKPEPVVEVATVEPTAETATNAPAPTPEAAAPPASNATTGKPVPRRRPAAPKPAEPKAD